MTRKTSIAGITLLLAAGLACAQEKVTLKQKYAPGKYQVNTTITSEGQTTGIIGESNQPRSAPPRKTVRIMKADLTIDVPDKDGVMKGTMVYRRAAIERKAGAVIMRYDSDDPNTASSPMGVGLKPIVGATISFEIAADGNIQNVTGIDEIWDALVKENPQLAPMATQMKKQFGGEQFRDTMMSASAGLLPKVAVAVGDTWKSSIDGQGAVAGSVVMSSDCKLAELVKDDGGKAQVDFDSKGNIDKPAVKTLEGARTTVDRMNMTQKGRLTFDLARNMICAITWSGDVDGSMTIVGADGQRAMVSSKETITTEATITPVSGGAASRPGGK